MQAVTRADAVATAGPPLVHAARAELQRRGAERVIAVAPLAGLCGWIVDGERWLHLDRSADGFDEEQPGAVEAVARGEPRPGHSVLGRGTFNAAKPAFEHLALEYAKMMLHAPDSECAAFRAADADLVGVSYMHASSEAALRDSAGCTASFELPAAAGFSIKHE